jgi:hypothetical protein
MLKKLNRWFELNCGRFFTNGRKQETWSEYLKNKYGDINTNEQKKVMVNYPPKCLVCESDMDSLRINRPLCDECLGTLKELIDKKKKKNEKRKSN